MNRVMNTKYINYLFYMAFKIGMHLGIGDKGYIHLNNVDNLATTTMARVLDKELSHGYFLSFC